MDNFIYSIPTKIAFGKGQIKNLPGFVSEFGSRVLLIYGGGSIKRNGIYEDVTKRLSDEGISYFELAGVEPNPRISTVRRGIEICKKENIDVLVPIGGGSSIDCSKAIAAGFFYDNDPWDIVKDRLPIDKALPIISILTLAATGSEMDQIAVISNDETNDKMAIGGYALFPKYSILDPEYTYTVPPYQTASGIADIMSHVFEVYLNGNKGLDIQKGMMESILKVCIKYGPVAVKNPEDYEARANIMWASSWAINGFISNGIGMPWPCHAMEHQLSAYYDVTHGHGLAILTPVWMKYILKDKTLPMFVEYGINVWGITPELSDMQIALLAIEKTHELFLEMGLSDTLSSIGIKDESNFDVMAQKAADGGLDLCEVPLTKNSIVEIFRECK